MAHVPLLLFLSICKPPADSYKYTAITTLSERAKIVIKHMNTGIIKAGKKNSMTKLHECSITGSVFTRTSI